MAAARNSVGKNHLQLRLPPELRVEIGEIAGRLNITTNDVIRGALHFGLPVFAAMSDLQDEVVRRFIRALKGKARKKC